MDCLRTGRLLRMLRVRRAWRLAEVSLRTGLSISTLSRHERGMIDSLRSLQKHGASLDVRFEVRPIGRASDLARTIDAEHAAIQNLLAASLLSKGARVEAEVSFSEWGERGRIDLLAAHHGFVIVVEVKTDLSDLQDLFGTLDVKVRLAPTIAARLGMEGSILPLLAVAARAATAGSLRPTRRCLRRTCSGASSGQSPRLSNESFCGCHPRQHHESAGSRDGSASD